MDLRSSSLNCGVGASTAYPRHTAWPPGGSITAICAATVFDTYLVIASGTGPQHYHYLLHGSIHLRVIDGCICAGWQSMVVVWLASLWQCQSQGYHQDPADSWMTYWGILLQMRLMCAPCCPGFLATWTSWTPSLPIFRRCLPMNDRISVQLCASPNLVLHHSP